MKVVENLQPVDFHVMRELAYELVTNAVNANSATDEYQLCVRWVLGDEVVCVKVRQLRSSDTACHLPWCK